MERMSLKRSCARRSPLRASCLIGRLFHKALALLLVSLSGLSPLGVAQKKQKLDRVYREWLERDAAYIITKDERDAFLRLATDGARDKFIESFWEIRNPNPGSPTNTYKDEIYQRIAFADARFGVGSGLEGWRTDRGHTYITLGPPQQKQVFRNSANLYPIEIWFYGNTNPSLPPFFYVMFYQREGSGDYRFYSPYTDGPDKLVTGVEAINSRAAALRLIRNSAGPEVARISLSLLPDEPVDEATGITSLESDILLNNIKNLANLPANRDEINRRRSMRESVTAQILLEGHNLDVVTFPARDSHGLTRIDYAIRLHDPGDLSVTEQTDWSKKTTYHTAREVEVPAPAKDRLVVPGVMPFLSADSVDPSLADLTPFTAGGVQFTPMPKSAPTLGPGTNLQIVYQIWAPAKDPRIDAGKKLHVEYAFGRPAASGSTTKIKDEVSLDQFDSFGSLVTGKKVSLEQQSVGNYMLTVSVNDSETKQTGFGTVSFKILDVPSAWEPWDVLEPGIAQDAEKGILDQQRGLCYWTFGRFDEARVWFRHALQLDHSNDTARARLVDAYFSKKDYAAVVSLYSDAGVTEATDSETLLHIATSLEKQGKPRQAISVIENALSSRAEDGPLYLALAQYYIEIGNAQKAAELTQKGKSFLGPASSDH